MTDKPPTKIPLSELEELERLLDKTPAYEVTAVSKQRAIERLAPKLYAMRAKGYSWQRIAEWLTAHGLGVTRATLQGYVRRVRGVSPRAGASGAKRRAAHAPGASATATTVTAAPQPRRRDAPAGGSAAGATEPVSEALSRRSAFVPRPDSDEI